MAKPCFTDNVSWQHPRLGTLYVRVNARAKRMVCRVKADGVFISVPPRTPCETLNEWIEREVDALAEAVDKLHRPLIDLDFRINSHFFRLSLEQGTHPKFLARSEPGNMRIVCPPQARFEQPELQTWLRKVIEEALRSNAKMILPPRLHQLSVQHGLTYQSLKINGSQSRWGSCSSLGSINLSYYLVLLPPHLIDYVLLHELTHTREMNHSTTFWDLLNRFTQGKALALREEIKKYKTDFI